MDSATRSTNYVAQNGKFSRTPAQRRRWEHKDRSRKSHMHIPGERCYTCRPAKRPKVALTPSRIRVVSR